LNKEENLKRKENGIIFAPQISTDPETGIWVNTSHCNAKNLFFFDAMHRNLVRYVTGGGIRIGLEEKVIAKLPDFWKASIIVHDGENEYRDLIFISGAANGNQAMSEARFQAGHYFNEEEQNTGHVDSWQEQHGYRIIELNYVTKIDTLEQLFDSLTIVDFEEGHVQR
jgi:hypothetical protein